MNYDMNCMRTPHLNSFWSLSSEDPNYQHEHAEYDNEHR
jgi:hypothetical protein